MSITIVQKSDLSNPKPNPKIALVLSGGGISGGAFKIGGLQALNSFMLNRKIKDFDMFVGISAGAIISMYLANGIPVNSIAESLEGKRGRLDPIRPSELYALNVGDILNTPAHILEHTCFQPVRNVFDFFMANNLFRREFRNRVFDLITNPGTESLNRFLTYCLKQQHKDEEHRSIPWHFFPNGIFTTDRFERSNRRNIESHGLCNDFVELYNKRGKELYIVAMKLDTAERVVFGHDSDNQVPITKAMQASIALPIFYKPVRLNGIDYIDGAVINTTSMDIAISKGADLIICYNPFRPFNQELYCKTMGTKSRPDIAEDGIYAVMNQVFRTVLHTRLMNGIRLYRKSPDFKGDIILLEPTEYDGTFFDMNPMAFWERRKAARRGYDSVKQSIGAKFDMLKKILNAYGIVVNPKFSSENACEPVPFLETIYENIAL